MPLLLVLEQLKADYDDAADDGLAEEDELRAACDALAHGVRALVTGGRGARLPKVDSGAPPPFRVLSKVLKQTIGTKVANKVLRNRGEALSLQPT